MDSLDKWAAEKCGINTTEGGISGCLLIVSDKQPLEIWTLSDARCREIVREHFGICTIKITPNSEGDNWFSYILGRSIFGEGKSTEEAELACIAAIREGEG
jgi:hypothetical protein